MLGILPNNLFDTGEKTGKRFGLLKVTEQPTKPLEVVNMDFVMRLPTAGDLRHNSALVLVCRITRKTNFIPVHKDIDAKEVAFA